MNTSNDPFNIYLLQLKSVILKDLKAIPLKCNHQVR